MNEWARMSDKRIWVGCEAQQLKTVGGQLAAILMRAQGHPDNLKPID
jgi:hypothetical protein